MSENLKAHNDRPKAQLIGIFLGRLANSVRHQKALDHGEKRDLIATYTEMLLRRDIPGFCYDLNALDYVLRDTEWFPTLNALADILEQYRRVHESRRQSERASVIQIGGPKRLELDEKAKMWLRYWRTGENLNWAIEPGEISVDDHVREHRRSVALSLLKTYARPVWEDLVGADDRSNDWQDERRIHRTLVNLDDHPMRVQLTRILKTAVERYSPRYLWMFEDEKGEKAA